MAGGWAYSGGFLAFLGICGFYALRETVLDFAGGKLADEALSNHPHGDVPFVPDDLKISLFHARNNSRGGQ